MPVAFATRSARPRSARRRPTANRPGAGPPAPPTFAVGRVARRAGAYFALTWGLLAALAAAWNSVLALAVLAVAAYTLVPIALFARRRGGWRRYPTAAFRLGVVRPALYAQLLLPIVSAASVIGLLVGLGFGRPVFGGQLAALGALGVSAAVLLAGWAGSRRLQVREAEAFVPGLPDALNGLRVVQLSDLHIGPQTSQRFLARAARAAGALRPDLVVLTGDLVDDRSEDAAVFSRWAVRLAAEARAPLGIVAVPGNHDVYAGWPAVAEALGRLAPVHVLVNDALVLRRGDATFAVVGTGDPAGGRGDAGPHVDRAFARVPAGMPVVALAHNPVLFPQTARAGAALTLSGHTHWGQLALPKRGWSMASRFNEFAMGGYQLGDALLYVHPGTGFWGLPFRLGAYPEVTAVTLRAAPSAGTGELRVGPARTSPNGAI